jgi:uncharacterized membrane protein YhdT
MIVALVWVLVVAVIVWLVATFIVKVVGRQPGMPPWFAQAVYIIATLIVLLYAVHQLMPFLARL